MSHAGSAGPTVDRLSDANPFVRNKKKEIGAEPVRYTGGYTELPQSEAAHGDGKLVADVQEH